MNGLEEPGPHTRETTCSPYTTLPGAQRQKPEGQAPSWRTACAPAILAESARAAQVKVRGHPLVEGPPTILRTSTRGPQLAAKRRPGSHPSDGPTGPPRIQARGRRVAHPSTTVHQGVNTDRTTPPRIPTKDRTRRPFANPRRDSQSHQETKAGILRGEVRPS